MSNISPLATQPSTSTTSSTTAVLGNEAVTQNQFMQLLVTQLENQDPTQPTDDSQMLAQLAQFSTLGQMQQLNQTQSLSQSASLIGQTVTAGTSTTPVTGTVSAVTLSNGNIMLTIDGQQVNASSVTAVQ